jgi:hypothetical protein
VERGTGGGNAGEMGTDSVYIADKPDTALEKTIETYGYNKVCLGRKKGKIHNKKRS